MVVFDLVVTLNHAHSLPPGEFSLEKSMTQAYQCESRDDKPPALESLIAHRLHQQQVITVNLTS